MASAGQVVGSKDRVEVRAGGVVENRVNDADGVMLIKEGLLINGARLHIVDALYIRNRGTDSAIGEKAVLAYTL
jgi:hypothetical protein